MCIRKRNDKTVIIAFVGAGGKTSCMLELARKWSQEGKKVLVTTTTHMESPEKLGIPGCVDTSAEEIQKKIEENGWIVAGTAAREADKIQGLSAHTWEKVKTFADMILVEADGSKRFPLKVPKQGEPVIPKGCNDIIIVAGARALGHPLKDVCFRHKQIENFPEDTILTPEQMGKLLQEGYVQVLQKQHPQAKLVVLLNQADLLENQEKTKKILQKQLSVPVFLHGWNKEVHAIYLAAGFSRRFQGNKLLFQLEGRPMYQHLLERLKQMKKEKIIQSLTVVTQYNEILEELQGQKIRAVKNKNSSLGISSSIKIGLETVQKHLKQKLEKEHYYLFSVADQPYLKKETLQEFISTFMKSEKGIGCISCKKNLGNPVIFHEKYLPELMALEGDTGGKKVLKKHLEDVYYFQIENEIELKDIDREE